ncbi:hypothetical protein GCM10020001_066400 [Nonomuraea salmonea]
MPTDETAKPPHTDEKDALVPEQVTELAGGDQEDRERQQIAAGHPLQVGKRRLEVRLDDRVGDADDRAVEHHHDDAQTDRQQNEPRVAPGPRAGRAGR